MTLRYSRRFILAGFLTSGAYTATANAPMTSPFPPKKPANFARLAAPSSTALIRAAGLSGSVGYVVANAKTGEILETHNPALALPPASVAKSVTALYAMHTLGLEHRFETQVRVTGAIKNGVLHGDLILVGSGDPTLGTDQLAALAKSLKGTGLHEVRGDFRIYTKALPYIRSIDKGQPDHLGYNPAISGLNLNFNRVHFEWKRANAGYSVVMDARSDHYRPEVHMAHMTVKKRDFPVYTYADGAESEEWTVASGALGNGGSRWLPVRRPELYTADVFATMARAQGIVLKKPRVTQNASQGQVLARHQSAPLSDIIRDMLKYSTNVTAEVLGLSASAQQTTAPRTLSGSGSKMARWAGPALGMKSARFADHSGLSDQSRVPADEMVAALVAARPNGALHHLMKDIKLKDDEGKVLTNHSAKVRAKTGTLNFVSALAGYITTANGTELAFAIFTADLETRAKIKRDDREVPKGGRAWSRKSRRLQQKFLQRWAALYT